MKILITGSDGQLGKEWCKYLKKIGAEPVCFNSDDLNITYEESIETVLNKEDPDVIINCAAYTAVDKAEENRKQANLVNHIAVRNLADACRKRGIKLVHFSTDYIFPGDATDKEKFPEGYSENSDTAPINYYGQTKLDGERALENSGCDYLLIRVSWLCGRFGNNFLKTMLKLADEKSILRVVGDQWGSPTFAENVVKNTHFLLEKGLSGTYHITSKGMTNWAGFARKIFECADTNVEVHAIPTSEYPTEAVRPKFSKLNTQKIENVEGVDLIHWEEGTENLVRKLQNS